MASGLAKRFGSNKLLAEFDRKPLLCRAFAVTEGLHRVVVTRSTEVQALCEECGLVFFELAAGLARSSWHVVTALWCFGLESNQRMVWDALSLITGIRKES